MLFIIFIYYQLQFPLLMKFVFLTRVVPFISIKISHLARSGDCLLKHHQYRRFVSCQLNAWNSIWAGNRSRATLREFGRSFGYFSPNRIGDWPPLIDPRVSRPSIRPIIPRRGFVRDSAAKLLPQHRKPFLLLIFVSDDVGGTRGVRASR